MDMTKDIDDAPLLDQHVSVQVAGLDFILHVLRFARQDITYAQLHHLQAASTCIYSMAIWAQSFDIDYDSSRFIEDEIYRWISGAKTRRLFELFAETCFHAAQANELAPDDVDNIYAAASEVRAAATLAYTWK